MGIVVHTFYMQSGFDVSSAENKRVLKIWSLSVHQIKNFGFSLCLICNSSASKVFIDKLKLPYDEVFIVLDPLRSYPSELWSLSKITAYGMLSEPFLHVDGDILFFDERYLKSLFTDSAITIEFENRFKNLGSKNILLQLKKFQNPSWLDLYIKDLSYTYKDYNCGLIGTASVECLNEFSSFAFDYTISNLENLKRCNYFNGYASQVIEQFLLRAYLVHVRSKIFLTKNNSVYDISRKSSEKIIHFYGKSGKRNPNFVQWVAYADEKIPYICKEIDKL